MISIQSRTSKLSWKFFWNILLPCQFNSQLKIEAKESYNPAVELHVEPRLEEVDTTIRTYTITELEPSTMYKVTIVARSSAGRGKEDSIVFWTDVMGMSLHIGYLVCTGIFLTSYAYFNYFFSLLNQRSKELKKCPNCGSENFMCILNRSGVVCMQTLKVSRSVSRSNKIYLLPIFLLNVAYF